MRASMHGPGFLRWAGSKRRIIPRLRNLSALRNRTYVEPFCGSAALFFAAEPPKAFLSDLNSSLIESFHVVRDKPKEIYREFALLPVSHDAYYRIRTEYNRGGLTLLQRAARFLYLNRYCFNGLWRTNRAGEFNVPFGGIASQPPPSSFIANCSKALSRANIESSDFRPALERHSGGNCFFFVDPPYFTHGARTFREYGPTTFSWSDFQDLAAQLHRLYTQGHIALVYCDTPEVRALFRGWQISPVDVVRNVGGFASRRKTQTEILITNFELDDTAP
jgi:DNA adenine methylase